MNLDRLYELREYENLYQKDIASILNVSQQLYSSWEKGQKNIPLKQLNLLANFYGISMDYILKLSDDKKKTFNKINILDKKVIGNNLKEVRKDNNLTQRELAKILNTTCSTICAYEKGKTLILTSFAFQICKKYHYSIDWLCGKSSNKYL